MSASGQVNASLLGLVSSFLGDDTSPPAHNTEPNVPPTATTATFIEEDDRDAFVRVVIFSKDRPWQLQQLFRSMRLQQHNSNDKLRISLELLVHITDNYRQVYEQVISSVETQLEGQANVSLTCHYEDATSDEKSFQTLLENILTSEDEPTHWMFLTDDCLLLTSLQDLLETATGALFCDSQIKCFLSRLHPGITWTQTRSLPSPPPRSFLKYQPGRTPYKDGVYVYPLERGELDWKYPWDLSGGIYSHSLVQSTLEKLRSLDNNGLSHPNRLEIAGNEAISPLVNITFLVSVPTRPMLLILAINRVQTVCQAPLACEETDATSWSPRALLSFYKEGKQLDITRYKALLFNSSHVGNLYFEHEGDEKYEAREERQTALSVLIPVHTGPPKAAKHSIKSIIMQSIEEFNYDCRQRSSTGDEGLSSRALCLSPMQIVLVDDRCTDGSINAMLETVQTVASEYSFVIVSMHDHRAKDVAAESNDAASMGEFNVELVVDIVSSPNPGVAVALNHGLSYCQSDLVARMDADDIAIPGRLQAQVAALRYRPEVDVVGTSTLLFRHESANNEQLSGKTNSAQLSIDALPYLPDSSLVNDPTMMNVTTSLPPTDAGFAAWAMLFSCSIAHPSIVYRKNAIIKVGGYDKTYSCAEDYALWLRMTTESCSCLVSIPQLGLWHRKHRSKSQRTTIQSDEALQASVNGMKTLLGSELKWNSDECLLAVASVVRNPDTASSLKQVNEAADLLVKLEDAFLRYHASSLTPREIVLIRKDCDGRIGELATLTVHRSFVDSARVNDCIAWKLWCERCPETELTMQRLALLCHNRRAD